MKVSFFSICAIYHMDEGRFQTEAEAFAHFKKLGMDSGDLFASDLGRYPMPYYVKLLNDAGLDADCLITTENIAAREPREREINRVKVKEQLIQMERCGIEKMMIAPSLEHPLNMGEYEKIRDLMIEGLNEMVAFSKGTKAQVTIENLSSVTRPDSRMQDLRYILDNVPGLGFVLDSANFFCIGEDVLQAYELLKDRTVHAHMKDWKWDPFGDLVRENLPRFRGCALGEGDVPLRQLIRNMKQDGYDGSLVIEVNSPITWEEYDSCVGFLKEQIEG